MARAAADHVSYPDTTWGPPLSSDEAAEIARRVRVQVSLDDALAWAEKDPGWGGAWIDQSAAGAPVFQFTKPSAEHQAALASRLPKVDSFRVEAVAQTYAELTAQQDLVASERVELARQGVHVTGVGVDVRENQLRITVDGATDAKEAVLRKRYSFPFVTVDGGVAVADACPATSCLPLKGGIGITVGNTSNWPCTVGYLARRTDSSPDTLVMITAGHCVHLGSSNSVPWNHGASALGYGLWSPNPSHASERVHTWIDNSYADVGAIGVGASFYPLYRNQILTGAAVRSITDTKTWNQQLVGSLVCRMGRTTGRQCGTIADNNEIKESAVTGYGSRTIQHTVVYNRDANGGDSGGPIFIEYTEPAVGTFAVLYGTHVHSQDGYVSSGGVAWYSPVDYGESQIEGRHTPFSIVPCTTSSCGLP